MRLSYEWLADHIRLDDCPPERVGELLLLHTAEVDSVETPGGGWPGVVAARVVGVRPHPDADRLRLVTVDHGEGRSEVVCGAPNVAEGQCVLFAPEGTVLPGGFKLERRKIRGVESAGMVLSERELGIGDDHSGIVVLDPPREAGTPARDILPGGAVIDIDNTAITSRPDLWGHRGFARELSAILDRDLAPLGLGDAPPDDAPGVEVTIEDPALCARYLGWVIEGIRVEPSPDWLRRRLEQAGQRPINNVVDLTNYILLELGQPIHAFDRRQIAGDRIVVRRSRAGEPVVTLDGASRELPADCCVIADAERAVAIAGIMGLQNSEVGDDTTAIVLEVANFEMAAVRAASRALQLRTESAVRFEKGLDPEGVSVAARRFVHLLKSICPTATVAGGPCDARGAGTAALRIAMPEGWLARRLGIPIDPARVDGILGRLGFGVRRGKGRLEVEVPSWRATGDVSIAEDVLEEVGRIHGYEKIPPLPLPGELEPVEIEPERAARGLARRTLALEAGLVEIHQYPFNSADDCRRSALEPGWLRLANSEHPGLDLMVSSLIPNLLKAVSHNLKHRDEVALFHVAPVFLDEPGGASEGLPRENERIAIALARREGGDLALEVKGCVEMLLDRFRVAGAAMLQEEGPGWLHPGRCAQFRRGKQHFAWFGEVHPAVARAWDLAWPCALAEIDLDALRAATGPSSRMSAISRFPTVPYDVAVVVDRLTPAAEVEQVLRRASPEYVRSVALFDSFEGGSLPPGKRSLAFRIVFGTGDRTLDGADVERLRGEVEKRISKRGWSLRG